MKESLPATHDDELMITRAELARELRRHAVLDMFLGSENTDNPWSYGGSLNDRLEHAINGWLVHFKLDPLRWKDYVTAVNTSRRDGKEETLAYIPDDVSCGSFLYDATYADLAIEENDTDWNAYVHVGLKLSDEFSVMLAGEGQFWEESDGDIKTEVHFDAQFVRT